MGRKMVGSSGRGGLTLRIWGLSPSPPAWGSSRRSDLPLERDRHSLGLGRIRLGPKNAEGLPVLFHAWAEGHPFFSSKSLEILVAFSPQ